MDLPPPQDCIVRMERGIARPAHSFQQTSAQHPITVHWNEPEDEALAVALLAATESAWDVLVDDIGFRAPLPDTVDGPGIDLYLTEQDPFYAWTASDSWADVTDGDGYNSTSAYAVFSRHLPLEAVESYAAHEFAHLTQWATDYNEPTLPIWEGTATSAQAWVLGQRGAWAADVPSFQRFPNAPTLLADGYQLAPVDPLSSFEYGAALWVMALDEAHGGSGEGAVALWDATASEGPINEPDVVDAVAALYGSLDDAMNAIAVARLRQAEDWALPGLDAQPWDHRFEVPIAEPTGPWLPEDLFITGQAFARYALDEGTHTVSVQSPQNMAAVWIVDGEPVPIEPALELSDATTAILAVTALGPPGWDGDDDPWVRADPTITVSRAQPSLRPDDPEPRSGCGCRSAGAFALWAPLLLGLMRRASTRRR